MNLVSLHISYIYFPFIDSPILCGQWILSTNHLNLAMKLIKGITEFGYINPSKAILAFHSPPKFTEASLKMLPFCSGWIMETLDIHG